jgi:hypothetical protein
MKKTQGHNRMIKKMLATLTALVALALLRRWLSKHLNNQNQPE